MPCSCSAARNGTSLDSERNRRQDAGNGSRGSVTKVQDAMGVGVSEGSVKMPETDPNVRIVVADTITKLPAEAAGAVVVSGSHGGLYPGTLAAKARVRAVILNDAGIGRDDAGIASLHLLERFGIAAAA